MNLMKMATGALTPIIANKLAGSLGLPEGIVRKAVSVGLPVLLAAFMKRGSEPDGQEAIGAALDKLPDNPLSGLSEMLGGGADSVRSAGQTGTDMLSGILGQSSTTSLMDSFAGYLGGNKETVGTLMGLVGAGALGSMKSAASEQNLDTGGLLKMLSDQKDEIADAIPADLASKLGGTGLLPSDLKAAAVSQMPTAEPEKTGGGLTKWIVGLVAAGLLLWLVPQFLGGGDEVATEVATDALVVDGVNLGDSFTEITSSLSETLAGITDVASAQSALEALTNSDNALGDLQTAIGGLGAEGQSAIATLVSGALPAISSTIQELLGNSDIAGLLQPVLDGILAKLTTMAG